MNQSMFHLSLGTCMSARLRNAHSESFTVAPLMTISNPIWYFEYDEIRPRSGHTRHSQVNPKYHQHVVASVAATRTSHYLRILCNQARLDRQTGKHYERFRMLEIWRFIDALRRVEYSLVRERNRVIKCDIYIVYIRFVAFWCKYWTISSFMIIEILNRILYVFIYVIFYSIYLIRTTF